jgi:hypothetical protein
MPFGHGCIPSSPAGALSLLSSARGGGAPWLIPAAANLSTRPSAALDELIAENRAALLPWQFSDRSPGRMALSSTGRVLPGAGPGWQIQAQPNEDGAAGRCSVDAPSLGPTTLDLMQTPTASAGAPFRPVPDRPARKDGGDVVCSSSDAWASV